MLQREEIMDDRFKIIFKCISGSHLYGTARPESDEDIRGVFIPTGEFYHGFMNKVEQVESHVPDETYWEITKFFRLCIDNNPNILELLFVPLNSKYTLTCTKEWEDIVANRELFLSTKARHTFSGYAVSQLLKAEEDSEDTYNTHFKKGIKKLINLLKEEKIDKEWIKSNFNKIIFERIEDGSM
jgi:predicted nucleotidyltransferase